MLERLERLEAEMREMRRRLDEFMPRREPMPPAPLPEPVVEEEREDRRRR